MELTQELKEHIDGLPYDELLRHWRNAPVGDPWFQGETGEYWAQRMKAMKDSVDHVTASKFVGWDHE